LARRDKLSATFTLPNVYKNFSATVNPPVAGIILYSLTDGSAQEKTNDNDDDIDPGTIGLALVTVYIAYPYIVSVSAGTRAGELGLDLGVAGFTTATAGAPYSDG
jgi:hypothetical protein